MQGSRENIAYFGLTGDVRKSAIEDIDEIYDVAIIDLPYNLYTHASWEEQFTILKHARRIAKKVVIVTIESMDDRLEYDRFSYNRSVYNEKTTIYS